MSLYGELDFGELGLTFAHYTARRGRAAKLHAPHELPKKFWKGGVITDDIESMLFITENGNLNIAPTAAMEVELPLTLEYKFINEDQKVEVEEYLLDFEIEVEFPDLEGVIRLTENGTEDLGKLPNNWTTGDVKEEPKPKPEPKKEKAPKKEKVEEPERVRHTGSITVTAEQVWKLFKLDYGDRIRVSDSFGWPIGEYLVTINSDAAPIIRNVQTKKEYDLFYLTGTTYEIISGR